MPFIGKDWRGPGNKWIRCPHTYGWEQRKLRPTQIVDFEVPQSSSTCGITVRLHRTESSTSLSCSDAVSSPSEDTTDDSDFDEYIPHCFVKTGKSKEFIGCTSMSEAFHRLDLTRATKDVRRFNYICKVVQILVQDKLQNLSATARKNLLAIIQAIVVQCVEGDLYISTIRSLLMSFASGLEGHVFGSPKLVSKQMDTVEGLLEFISERRLRTLADGEEDSVTFMELPRELLLIILRKLPNHISLLEIAKAHETLEAIVQHESQLWRTLCIFHFSQEQIERHFNAAKDTWRHIFFELKKFYGLREVYADLIHLCCHCKALFWKSLGHPCVSKDAPSVRVTPKQFVDMLLFL